MNISLLVGLMMLAVKWIAYAITGSVAIFSDAAESVVHIVAVGFAWYSLRVTYRPPDEEHHFGHDKVAYFSAGAEGMLIIVAAGVIIYSGIDRIVSGGRLEQVDSGSFLTATAAVVNAVLGWYLVKTGRNNRSFILVANGRHILTDAWTSGGAIVGLLAAHFTQNTVYDGIAALLFGANIILEGFKLLRRSVNGLMDRSNPVLLARARKVLDDFCAEKNISYHRLRLRESGHKVFIDFHVQFPDGTPIEEAHALADEAEVLVARAVGIPSDVFSHLESMSVPEDHE